MSLKPQRMSGEIFGIMTDSVHEVRRDMHIINNRTFFELLSLQTEPSKQCGA